MADTSGQADIRGLHIDKVSKDYFEEALIFKREVSVMSTPSREIRYYSKTSGYLTHGDNASISALSEGAMPFVLEESWTRSTTYTKKYMLDSPIITMEDESDSDVQVFLKNVQGVTEAVANDVDGDIWDVVSESQSPTNINDVTSTAAWDAASGQNPAEDIFEAEQLIREQTKQNPSLKLYVSAKGYKDLKTWIITNGANMTNASSDMVIGGRLVEFAGLPITVSENVTADYAMVADLKRACEYKEFTPLKSYIIEEEGIGRKVRVVHNGVAILTKPKYVALISNTES